MRYEVFFYLISDEAFGDGAEVDLDVGIGEGDCICRIVYGDGVIVGVREGFFDGITGWDGVVFFIIGSKIP